MDNRFSIGQATDPGIRRRNKPNQDSIGFVPSAESGGKAPILLLADGMGGYAGGEIASSLAVATIAEQYSSDDTAPVDYSALLRKCIVQAHNAIRKRALENEQLASMGSTIVLAALEPNTLHIANVGDSRALFITADQKVRQISYDHSFVMDLVRAGGITKEEALHHPRRNVLTMSLNGKRDDIDPFVTDIPWKKGDTILICSDGLWGCVTESQIANIVTSMDPQEACGKLIKMANMNQGPDNISVLIARNGIAGHTIADKTGTETSSPTITGENIPTISLKASAPGSKKILAAGLVITLILGTILAVILSSKKRNPPVVDPTLTPTVTLTEIATHTATIVPTDTIEPTATPVPTDTATLTATIVPTDTIEPTATQVPTDNVDFAGISSDAAPGTANPTPTIVRTEELTETDSLPRITGTVDSFSWLLPDARWNFIIDEQLYSFIELTPGTNK